MSKLFSPACERNSAAILQAITPVLADCSKVLEIGSGTGQHAAYFASHLPQLQWQTSDRRENHPSILAWKEEAGLANLLAPLELNIGHSSWPTENYDAVFTANTCHIMAWAEVVMMFSGVVSLLRAGGRFCIYGPFNYQGHFTSSSNYQFDVSLKQQASHMGIRDMDDIEPMAEQMGLHLQDDIAMPANNRLLVFIKQPVRV